MHAFPKYNIKRNYYCTFDLKVCKEQSFKFTRFKYAPLHDLNFAV